MAWTKATNILDGVNALGTLLDSTKTNVDVAAANVVVILSAIQSAEYGLQAIKKAVDSGGSTDVEVIKNAVLNTQYGLEKIRSLIAPVD